MTNDHVLRIPNANCCKQVLPEQEQNLHWCVQSNSNTTMKNQSSLLLLPLLLLLVAHRALSRQGDLTNPDAQNIQLVESDRILGASVVS